MTGKRAERLQVMLTHEEVIAVDEWRFENRMPSRSAAARALMNLGLRAERTEHDKEALLGRPISSGDIGIVDERSRKQTVSPRTARSILLADSDFLSARGIRSVLAQQGFDIVGPVASTDEAIALAREIKPMAAILETCLQEGENVEKLADELSRNNIPYLFCTTRNPRDHMAERFWSSPVVNKEQAQTALPQMISRLLS